MAKFEVGQIVKLKKGVKEGEWYGSHMLYKGLLFKDSLAIVAKYEDETYRLQNGGIYYEDILELAPKFKVGDVVEIIEALSCEDYKSSLHTIRRITNVSTWGYESSYQFQTLDSEPLDPKYWWSEKCFKPVDFKYAIGDKVTIRSDLVGGNTYGDDSFVEEMEPFRGSVVTIKDIRSDGGSQKYKVVENSWNWTEEMFEKEKPSEYNVGDIVLIKNLDSGEDYPFGLNSDMIALSGQACIIKEKNKSTDWHRHPDYDGFCYKIDQDDGKNSWSSPMFETKIGCVGKDSTSSVSSEVRSAVAVAPLDTEIITADAGPTPVQELPKSRYHKGQLIKLRKDLLVGTKYGSVFFVKSMKDYTLTHDYATITEVFGDDIYYIDKTGDSYYWTAEMFEEVVPEPKSHDFVPGEHVLVRPDLENLKSYGGRSFVGDMVAFRGQIVTIEEKRFDKITYYIIKEDKYNYNWTPEMLLPVHSEIYKQYINNQKQKENENQLQGEDTPLIGTSKCTGTGICYPGESIAIVVRHIGNREETCMC